MVEGEGMPHHGNPFVKGRLFLHFQIKFPKKLPLSVVTALKTALPAPPSPMLSEDDEECNMQVSTYLIEMPIDMPFL